ncbi:MAG TPA: NADH-quinone oxidoreductase subunit M [Anaerolineae bacterium]|nr:NADH-quinone oxidoreductase subunit M [Anaerolineae bacterium]
MEFSFPILSMITLSPLLVAVIILMLPEERGENARMLGLAAMVFGLVLSLWMYITYYINLEDVSGVLWEDTLMFMETYEWLPSIGINYIVGVDGLSATLVLLTAFVGVGGVLISWSVPDRPREFFAFFMLLVAGVHGVFVAVDAFLLFFFYELAVLPMYVMIVMWGWKERREYAGMKLTLYLLIGSFISFIAFLVLYFTPLADGSTIGTFDLRAWAEVDFPVQAQIIWFMPLFLGFAILSGLWPFHNWSPDGHVAAPTAVSMIHAGVLMKLGAYASMRVGIQILPIGAVYWFPFVILLTLINVVYGSLIAMRQRDMKYMIGYSSVSHMGLVSMGFAAMNVEGFVGAGIQMVSHGIMTALFFAIVGMIYDRAHSRNMDELSGMRHVLPLPTFAFVLSGLVSMGMPGLSGFIAEFPIFMGVWRGRGINIEGTFGGLNPADFYSIVAIMSALGIIITAAYVLRAINDVFLGEYEPEKWHDMRPIMAIDKVVLISFGACLVIIGLFPGVIAPMIESGVTPVVERLNDAQLQDPFTVLEAVNNVTTDLLAWFGGA